MNISGIRPSEGFYDNNTMRIRSEMGNMNIEQQEAEKQKNLPFDGPSVEVEISNEGFARVKSANIERAVSNMEQDTAIHRYQYFVQSKDEPSQKSSEIRGNENFTL